MQAVLINFLVAGAKVDVYYCVTKKDGSRVHVLARHTSVRDFKLEQVEKRKPEKVEVTPCSCKVFTLPEHLEYAIEE